MVNILNSFIYFPIHRSIYNNKCVTHIIVIFLINNNKKIQFLKKKIVVCCCCGCHHHQQQQQTLSTESLYYELITRKKRNSNFITYKQMVEFFFLLRGVWKQDNIVWQTSLLFSTIIHCVCVYDSGYKQTNKQKKMLTTITTTITEQNREKKTATMELKWPKTMEWRELKPNSNEDEYLMICVQK